MYHFEKQPFGNLFSMQHKTTRNDKKKKCVKKQASCRLKNSIECFIQLNIKFGNKVRLIFEFMNIKRNEPFKSIIEHFYN